MFRKIINFFLFSSLFIACCAIVMVYQTLHLVHYSESSYYFYGFVFCSTVCSYNAHWYLSPFARNERDRSLWSKNHRSLQLVLSIAGALGSLYFLSFFIKRIYWLLPSVILTFLYTAPKIPHKAFTVLRKLAIGKTIYLAFVWTYVTTAMPLLVFNLDIREREWLFCISRFFLIYAICILFDFRDREQDKQDGIRSLITYFEETAINRLFFGSLLVFSLATIGLYRSRVPLLEIGLMLVPGVILLLLYPIAKRNFSDYLYYFGLDGLMMFSALCTVLLSF